MPRATGRAAVYANEDAIRHYERALRALSGCLDCIDLVVAVRERLGDLLALTGRREEALAHYEAARQESEIQLERCGCRRASIARSAACTGRRATASVAKACFAKGLERLGEDGDPIERAQLFQEVGRLAFRAGDNAGAIAWARQALAEADKATGCHRQFRSAREATVTRAQAYNTLGVALARTGQLREAVEQIERSVALGRQPRPARQPVEPTRTSASSTARSTRSEASRRASRAWRRPRRWAISGSSRGSMPTWRSPIARSLTAARPKASRRRKRPSIWIDGWDCSTTWRCR